MSATARRAFLAQAGSIVVAFSLPGRAFAQTVAKPAGPVPNETNPTGNTNVPADVSAWIVLDTSGTVGVHFGKVELGTGIATSIAQIVADEMDVPFASVRVLEADTSTTPDQGYTAGSASLSAGAIPVRQAAAAARLAILDLASAKLGVPVDKLQTADGRVSVAGEDRSIAYRVLVDGAQLHRTIAPAPPVKNPDTYRVVGKSLPRVELPAKVYGSFVYLQNVRLPGMLHGRIVYPAAYGATLASVDEQSVAGLPGVRIVRKDSFLGVVAPSEWVAIQAMRKIKATWTGGAIAQYPTLEATVKSVPEISQKAAIDVGNTATFGSDAVTRTYAWPYQTHGSIGPSCGVADVKDGKATIWSATQGVFFLRGAIAQMLGFSNDSVRVKFVEGAGCYGHNGADDASAAAALMSQAVGKPVRVQYMRDQEHGWDPKGGAMVITATAALTPDKQRISAWKSDVWSPTHSTRPGGEAGNLLPGRLINVKEAKLVFTGGDRDAKVNYELPNYRVTMHNMKEGVVHVSAMRGLGGTQNTFANESFMDEMAILAGADPFEFRMRHIANDPRGTELMVALKKLANWQPRTAPPAKTQLAKGRGVAYVRYENTEAYVAAVADVTVNRKTGAVRVDRIAIAHDCGLIVNPDGLKNQIEGNAIQATSRATKEHVTYDKTHVTSLDWNSYPIVRFRDVPDVTIALIDRPHEHVLGAGEATTTVIAPSIANAIHDALGIRLREVPFTSDKVLAALKTA